MDTASSRSRFLLGSLLVALLAGLVFIPGLPGVFVFDDIPNIVNNDSIHVSKLDARTLLELLSTKQMSGSMRGLPTLTFALDYWRAGGVADPATFKTTNILIHALTACVLAWLLRSLLRVAGLAERRAACLAIAMALAWAVHPLQVSSVLYSVQRLQTMGTLFLVLALAAYVQARRAQIQDISGTRGILLAILAWALAMGCKEDSILLPLYTLALELTLLRFAAADPRTRNLLQRGYLVAALAGLLVYAFWVVPHFWQWDLHAGRDFSTLERLLTQPRVLCMYLGQILLPLPQHMPFYYDWVQPSRSLLQPWTTLLAIAVVAGLLGLAWGVRKRMPLVALGIFLFFGAHTIASNVVPLELAFEHRNHFALVGVVLAVGSLLASACQWAGLRPALQTLLCGAILVAVASSTLLRSLTWSNGVSLIEASTQAAPSSARAWVDLCDAYFIAGGGVTQGNPYLDEAILACTNGTANAPQSLNSPALLIALKSLRGDVSPEDWKRLQQRLNTVRMTWDNTRAPLILTHYAGQGVQLDKAQLLQALATLDRRVDLGPSTLAYIGTSIMNDLMEPESAMHYFLRAVKSAPPGDPLAWELGAELRKKGKPELANSIESAGEARRTGAALPTGRQTITDRGYR
jgi:protein O-mannosyl-transferase